MNASDARTYFSPATDKERDKQPWDVHFDEVGMAPGTLVIDHDAAPTELTLIDYDSNHAIGRTLHSPEEVASHLQTDSVSWIDLQGLGNESLLKQIGQLFNIHPLMLEDVVNVPQRPKIDNYGDQLLIILQMILPSEEEVGYTSEQLSLILGKNYLLTVQEELRQDCLDPVRQRIRYNKGQIRQSGPDYLAYALIDAVIDAYFPVLERYGDYIEELEDEVLEAPDRSTVQKIYRIRRELMSLRRTIWPQRNALSQLLRDGSELLDSDIQVYLQDCYDHIVQVLEIVETFRELTANLMEMYLSSMSNRMNEVMKTLTVISSIFIPLSFIVGLYGMNFNPDVSPWNMPELNSYWGYPICLMVMGAIAASLSIYFFQRGWFKSTVPKQVSGR